MVIDGRQARIEGAELTRMGQKNALRRYPLHFHMLGEGGTSSYLRKTSIHETYNRCLTVHGTDRLRISGNVCHDHLGHGYFFEDGAEGERLLPSEGSPATFWITNPDNVVRNYVAAGSEGKGFWLAYPKRPTGLSTAPNVWPRRTPLGEFSGNTAHSNDGDGLHIDGGPRPDGTTETTVYEPRANPADGGSDIVPARFTGFAAYKNRSSGAWIQGGHLIVSGATFADNAIGMTFANHENTVQHSFFVGETANNGNPRHWETTGADGRSLARFWDPDFPIRGFEFYDGRNTVAPSTFAEFTPNAQRQAGALGYLLSDAFYIHPKNAATGTRFSGANRVYMPDPEPGMYGDASKVFRDVDGSVTGAAGRYVVTGNPFLLTGSCGYREAWNSHVCGGPYGTLEVGTTNGGTAAVKPVRLTRGDGEVQTLMGCCADSTSAESSILANRTYAVDFNGGTPPETRFVLSRIQEASVTLEMPYPEESKVTRWGCDLSGGGWCGDGRRGSREDLANYANYGYYYDPAAQTLYLKIHNETGNEYNEIRVEPGSP